VIPGSLRAASHNRALAAEAARRAPDGTVVEIFDGLRELPHYDEDLEHAPGAAVEDFRRRLREADALLFATPEYNGSIPGVLKNAVDWASRPFGRGALLGKPAAVIGASTGQFGAAWAQADLRKSLGIAGAHVLDAELRVPKAHDAFDEEGRLDPELTGSLDDILGGLLELVREVEAELAAEVA
jgi:chromate reductase